MRRILIGFAMIVVAFPAWAQTRSENVTRCEGDDPDAAIEACSTLLLTEREWANIGAFYNNRGEAYGKKGLYDQALADLNRALAADPRDAAAYANRGIVYRRKGNYRNALDDENKAIALKPDFFEAYINRGAVYSDQGRYDLAIADETKAIGLS
ncbi:MAG: tetratricopeptide repeat protein, partial [Stellaceae bacterium]